MISLLRPPTSLAKQNHHGQVRFFFAPPTGHCSELLFVDSVMCSFFVDSVKFWQLLFVDFVRQPALPGVLPFLATVLSLALELGSTAVL